VKVVGATFTQEHVADGGEPSSGVDIPDSSAPTRRSDEALMVELKNKLSLDGQRETLASSTLSIYHRIGMAIISNMKC